MEKRNKPAKREAIIASALDLFGHTHNVKKVSLESIARAAAVSPTTIYNLFGTRENLIFEVVKLLSLKTLEKNRRIIHSDLPFDQKLFSIISGKQDLMSQYDAELIQKIIREDESMRPFIEEIYTREIRPLWYEVLREGKKSGYIDESLNDEAFLLYLDVVKAGLSARQDLMVDFARNPALIIEFSKLMFFGFLKKDIVLFKEV